MLLRKDAVGKRNWVSDVKNILTKNGFGFVWMNQGVGHEQAFLSEFRERLVLCFRQNWHAELEENERCRWCSSFKDVFQAERYLNVVTNKWHRDCLINFRMRTLGLNANKHWFLTQSINQACPFCQDAQEDEFHVVFCCTEYTEIRKKCTLFNTQFVDRKSLIDVLKSENDESVRSLARFIAEATNHRQKKIPQDIENN